MEVGTAKSDYIGKLDKFQQTDNQAFTTTIVAFREDSSGRISDLKKATLDPDDSLTKVNWFEVQNWPAGSWPVLRLRYTSYLQGGASLTTIEWDALLDIATASFLSRMPSGIFVSQKSGEQTGDILSAHRVTSAQIAIVGNTTKKTIAYSCSEPCVVDGPTLLALWGQ